MVSRRAATWPCLSIVALARRREKADFQNRSWPIMAQQTFDCGDRAARRERRIRLAELAASADNLGCRAQAAVKEAVKEAAKEPE